MRKLACMMMVSGLFCGGAALAQQGGPAPGDVITDTLGRIIGGATAPREETYRQGYDEGYERGRQGQQPPPAPYAGSPYSDDYGYQSEPRLNGTVRWANPDAGVAGVDTGRGTVRVRGTPRQIERLRPGDQVSLPFEDVNGTPWIAGHRHR